MPKFLDVPQWYEAGLQQTVYGMGSFAAPDQITVGSMPIVHAGGEYGFGMRTITINGASTSSKSIYAPEGAGTDGYILYSNGSGSAPSWKRKFKIGSLSNNSYTFLNDLMPNSGFGIIFGVSSTSASIDIDSTHSFIGYCFLFRFAQASIFPWVLLGPSANANGEITMEYVSNTDETRLTTTSSICYVAITD